MEEEITNRIETVRKQASLVRLCKLQERSGVGEQTLLSFRSGRSVPTTERFLRIEAALRDMFEEIGREVA